MRLPYGQYLLRVTARRSPSARELVLAIDLDSMCLMARHGSCYASLAYKSASSNPEHISNAGECSDMGECARDDVETSHVIECNCRHNKQCSLSASTSSMVLGGNLDHVATVHSIRH